MHMIKKTSSDHGLPVWSLRNKHVQWLRSARFFWLDVYFCDELQGNCVLRLGLRCLHIDAVLLNDPLSPPLLVSRAVDTCRYQYAPT